jgi:hypothetical protein
MLKAAVPEVQLPKWFEVNVKSSDAETVLSLHAVVDGKTITVERSIAKDSASVSDLIGLWPDTLDKVPNVARRILDVLPVPRQCKLTGGPSPDQPDPTKERARLRLEARVAGQDLSWHHDSDLDRLYMTDLVEMIDWIKAIQKQKDEVTSDRKGAAS